LRKYYKRFPRLQTGTSALWTKPYTVGTERDNTSAACWMFRSLSDSGGDRYFLIVTTVRCYPAYREAEVTALGSDSNVISIANKFYLWNLLQWYSDVNVIIISGPKRPKRRPKWQKNYQLSFVLLTFKKMVYCFFIRPIIETIEEQPDKWGFSPFVSVLRNSKIIKWIKQLDY